ncbi:NAD-dependent succinate-semialdehyde dehydrogenase [Cupriavidus sp. IK-TO18]|uniref:NAD-dependent succinate-semialdehyde dehydrogenase n=1 Tax=Cupriavidus sp. IK-TO18 TaxID=2782182 RepID=UPI00189A70E1|nr:NAD-dependent succinate-semialdehyde dehydrogenase [Cupriavidus sp. IK-TO18]MBF6992514.1 NAD-dependent succinate-semialdehyde dehydrogenase [Cupriavidus sp. IK-TO18]
MHIEDNPLVRNACLINGKWLKAEPHAWLPVLNPATGETLANVPMLSHAEAEAAIDAASKALPAWASTPAKKRAEVLMAWARLIRERTEDLARILTAEQGKPIHEARSEIAYANSFVEWFAEEAKRIDGDLLQSPTEGQKLLVLKQPVGVTAAITPWNFPAAMVTRKVAPALAAGCTMIVKPAGETPLTALALAALAEYAGMPAGVLQVITGKASEIGRAFCESETVGKISFTGSTEIGRVLAAQSAATIKKLSLELGGNAPVLVFDDADVDTAVQGIMAAKFRNAGQTCVCANRIYVQSAIYDQVATRLAAEIRALRVGDGMAHGTNIGPLINHAAVARVREHIADAVARGGSILAGGKLHALGGTFFEPTLVGGVTDDALIANEETFGPVAPLIKFESEEDALRMANNSIFGLASYFFTRDHARIWRVMERLEAGMVGVNTGLISNEVGPFGGIKQSGLGREGSRYGIEEYLELKYACIAV